MFKTILPDQVEQTNKHKAVLLTNSFDQSEETVSAAESLQSG